LESLDARPGDELLSGEVFHTVAEAPMLVERWRCRCDRGHPRSALDYRPLAPEVLPFGQAGRSTAEDRSTLSHSH